MAASVQKAIIGEEKGSNDQPDSIRKTNETELKP
jgi:hypothetical protein